MPDVIADTIDGYHSNDSASFTLPEAASTETFSLEPVRTTSSTMTWGLTGGIDPPLTIRLVEVDPCSVCSDVSISLLHEKKMSQTESSKQIPKSTRASASLQIPELIPKRPPVKLPSKKLRNIEPIYQVKQNVFRPEPMPKSLREPVIVNPNPVYSRTCDKQKRLAKHYHGELPDESSSSDEERSRRRTEDPLTFAETSIPGLLLDTKGVRRSASFYPGKRKGPGAGAYQKKAANSQQQQQQQQQQEQTRPKVQFSVRMVPPKMSLKAPLLSSPGVVDIRSFTSVCSKQPDDEVSSEEERRKPVAAPAPRKKKPDKRPKPREPPLTAMGCRTIHQVVGLKPWTGPGENTSLDDVNGAECSKNFDTNVKEAMEKNPMEAIRCCLKKEN